VKIHAIEVPTLATARLSLDKALGLANTITEGEVLEAIDSIVESITGNPQVMRQAAVEDSDHDDGSVAPRTQGAWLG